MSIAHTETSPMVFIVDDDEPIRDSISMLLDTLGIPHAVFADAPSFLEAVGKNPNGIAVLDIRMPGMSGLDIQDQLISQGTKIPIVFITGHGDVPMAVEAMKKGAIDFIRKPFRDQELLDSINEALNTEEKSRQQDEDITQAVQRASTLTPREQEVFERIAKGQANKVVAIELEISERTVEIHRSQVMKKMEVRSLAALVRCKLLLEQENQ
jgi:two-component system response regulator FixJ